MEIISNCKIKRTHILKNIDLAQNQILIVNCGCKKTDIELENSYISGFSVFYKRKANDTNYTITDHNSTTAN